MTFSPCSVRQKYSKASKTWKIILICANDIFQAENTLVGRKSQSCCGTDDTFQRWLIHGEGGLNKLLFAQIGNIEHGNDLYDWQGNCCRVPYNKWSVYLIKLISGLHCWGKVRKKTERKNEGTRVAKCIFFYTDQNRQTRFYPKKGRNTRPFYHLTKKIQNGQKLPKKGLISPIYFSSKLFTPTYQFYTDISQLWQRTDTLKKLSPIMLHTFH